MRQAQQNRRGRGRNNNRKGQNPLTRSYESNGPDVKIRGTPSHIAEKYVTMARDALSSGDPVLAENYLQHAEHYNRIIMTHREQQVSQQSDHGQPSHNAVSRHRNPGDPIDDENAAVDEVETVARGKDPQPTIDAGENSANTRASRDRSASERSGESEDRPRRRSSSSDRGDRGDRDRPAAEGGGSTRSSSRGNGRSGGRRERYAQSDDQPEFLKRPVRRPRSSSRSAETEDAPAAAPAPDEAAE